MYACCLLVLFLGCVQAYPDGAPCNTLTPNHGGSNRGTSQRYQLLFNPPMVNGRATPGQIYQVALSGTTKGFVLQVDSGSLEDASGCGKFSCGDDKFLTHSRKNCPLQAYWTAPSSGSANFRYTALESFSTYSADNQMRVDIGLGGGPDIGPGPVRPVPVRPVPFTTRPPFRPNANAGSSESNSNSAGSFERK